jgi:hypothetical protein
MTLIINQGLLPSIRTTGPRRLEAVNSAGADLKVCEAEKAVENAHLEVCVSLIWIFHTFLPPWGTGPQPKAVERGTRPGAFGLPSDASGQTTVSFSRAERSSSAGPWPPPFSRGIARSGKRTRLHPCHRCARISSGGLSCCLGVSHSHKLWVGRSADPDGVFLRHAPLGVKIWRNERADQKGGQNEPA